MGKRTDEVAKMIVEHYKLPMEPKDWIDRSRHPHDLIINILIILIIIIIKVVIIMIIKIIKVVIIMIMGIVT